MRLPLKPPSKGGRNLSARAHAKRTRTRTLQNTSFCKVEFAKYTKFAFFYKIFAQFKGKQYLCIEFKTQSPETHFTYS